MPNWCENYLEVHGPESQLIQLKRTLDAEMLFAGVDSIDDRLKQIGESIVVEYPTKWRPALEELKLIANRFHRLTFTLLYYEFNMGIRGYVVCGPHRDWESRHEENVDLYKETTVFPPHYPVPAGSSAWAASARSEDEWNRLGF